MPGFKTKKPKHNDEELEDDDDLDLDDSMFDSDDDDDDFDDEPKKNKPKEQKKRMPARQAKEPPKKNMILIGVAIVIVVAIIGMVGYIVYKKTRPLPPPPEPPKVEKPKDEVAPGAPNVLGNSEKENKTEVSGKDVILKDLNGKPVGNHYKISRIETRKDFINYKKMRAVTADGLEFNWLEATYKGKPYKVQVPLKLAKQLEQEGITVVQVEVCILEDNKEIVTYMSLDKDAASLLN